MVCHLGARACPARAIFDPPPAFPAVGDDVPISPTASTTAASIRALDQLNKNKLVTVEITRLIDTCRHEGLAHCEWNTFFTPHVNTHSDLLFLTRTHLWLLRAFVVPGKDYARLLTSKLAASRTDVDAHAQSYTDTLGC